VITQASGCVIISCGCHATIPGGESTPRACAVQYNLILAAIGMMRCSRERNRRHISLAIRAMITLWLFCPPAMTLIKA